MANPTRTTFNIELSGDELEMARAVKERLNCSWPAMFKQYFFKFAEIEERALEGLANGSTAQIADNIPEMERKFVRAIGQVQLENQDLKSMVQDLLVSQSCTAALLDAFAKDFFVYAATATEDQQTEMRNAAAARRLGLIKSAAKGLQGGQARVLTDLQEQMSQNQKAHNAGDLA